MPRANTTYLATSAITNGQFGLYWWDFGPARSGPDPHFHRTITESFYVLSGTVSFHDGEAWSDHTVGDFLFVPEGQDSRHREIVYAGLGQDLTS
ncbi:MAG: cupin domain-containing protein [Streptosporangiaceae bacterium]